MLVLSRRPDEKILLPSVPAILKVISSQAGLVRLGIKAPSHVPILREELCRGEKALSLDDAAPESDPGPDSPHLRYSVRNRLHNLALGLALLRMRLVDCETSVRQTLDGMDAELQVLRVHFAALTGEPAEPVGSPDSTRV
jgi:carbon storage regulator CsrA